MKNATVTSARRVASALTSARRVASALPVFHRGLNRRSPWDGPAALAGNGTPPYFGGKFTTNETSNGQPDANALGKIWVENIAASLGIVITPAEVGFGTSSVMCPAAAVPALASSCTAYGQGGSRVTDPNGIGHASGALTVPVVTQIANHLARFGSFKSSDLIFVYVHGRVAFVILRPRGVRVGTYSG